MPTTAAMPATHMPVVTRAPARALASWVLFDWAVQPFFTLVVTFLFAPYFANTVVGDADRGQQLWGFAAAVAGLAIAIGSPYLGAMADGRGRRKPWIGLFSLIFAGAMASLWLATPAAPALTIAVVLLAFIVAYTAAEFTTVFTNAIMPSLVPPEELGRLSGTGWAVGYAGGLVALILVAGFLVPLPGSSQTFFGFAPLLALGDGSGGAGRFVGPFSALWYLVFLIPFFLFVPDARAVARPATRRPATAELWDTIRSLPAHPNMLYFLVARMLYADGLSAIFLFGGIYGAAVFGWALTDLALWGIAAIVAGVIGAFAGGFLDDRLGSKRVIVSALILLLLGAVGILSVDKTHVLYVMEVAPKAPGSPTFSSTGEMVFLAFTILIGMVSAPVGAASRSLLARLAPPDKITQYFGLFAFSGKATAFLAPALVASVTGMTGDQRIGMAAIVLFLLAGMVLMGRVVERRV